MILNYLLELKIGENYHYILRPYDGDPKVIERAYSPIEGIIEIEGNLGDIVTSVNEFRKLVSDKPKPVLHTIFDKGKDKPTKVNLKEFRDMIDYYASGYK